MITTNVFSRVFHLRLGDSTATGIAIDIDDKAYLVTARHFAENIADSAEIQIHHDDQWKSSKVKLVGHAPGEIDITVMAPPSRLVQPELVLPADIGGLSYGQDVYFLGFPYGWFGELGEINQRFPMPFVKRAIVSCLGQEASGVKRVYLDGHNNKGFSGGPVVFREGSVGGFKIASVVSGYNCVREPVFHGSAELPLSYEYNTGIVLSYSVYHAVELARANPIGPPVAV